MTRKIIVTTQVQILTSPFSSWIETWNLDAGLLKMNIKLKLNVYHNIYSMNYVFHIFLRCASAVGPFCLFCNCIGDMNTQYTGQGVCPHNASF